MLELRHVHVHVHVMSMYMHMCMCMHMNMYMYMCVCVCMRVHHRALDLDARSSAPCRVWLVVVRGGWRRREARVA